MFKKVYIEITNLCNLNCKFCPPTKRLKGFMTVGNFERIIKQIYKKTNLVCLHVKGEPLLHPDLLEILKVLEKYDLKTNITTNGVLLKEKLEILKQSKSVRQINISLHSFTENKMINEEYFDNIFKSVRELPNVIVSYRLWNLTDISKSDKNKDIITKLEQNYHIYNLKAKMETTKSIKVNDNIYINQDTEFTWPNINGPVIIEKGRCLALKEQIAILVDGTVVPCCLDNDGDIPLGNIFERDLDAILNSPKTKEIKDNFQNKIITCRLCKSCGFLKRLEEKRKNNNLYC